MEYWNVVINFTLSRRIQTFVYSRKYTYAWICRMLIYTDIRDDILMHLVPLVWCIPTYYMLILRAKIIITYGLNIIWKNNQEAENIQITSVLCSTVRRELRRAIFIKGDNYQQH